MHHPVEHRREDQAGHADEQQTAIDGVDALEQLAAVVDGLVVRPHAAKYHGSVTEGPEPAQPLEIAIAEHADAKRHEHHHERDADIGGKPAEEQPARGERLAAVLEPREEPRQGVVLRFRVGHDPLLTRNPPIRRLVASATRARHRLANCAWRASGRSPQGESLRFQRADAGCVGDGGIGEERYDHCLSAGRRGGDSMPNAGDADDGCVG